MARRVVRGLALSAGLLLVLASGGARAQDQGTGEPGATTDAGEPGGGSLRYGDSGRRPGGGTESPASAFTDPTRDPTRWESWWAWNRDDVVRIAEKMRRASCVSTPASGENALPPLPGDADVRAEQDAILREELAPMLLGLLDDEDASVRVSAAIAVARCRLTEAAPVLREMAAKDRYGAVRDAALVALGLLRDPADASLMSSVLMDKKSESQSRGVAAMALGLVGGPDAGPFLATFLAQPRGIPNEVRATAILAQGSCEGVDVEKQFYPYLDDRNGDAILRAASILAITRNKAPVARSLAMALICGGRIQGLHGGRWHSAENDEIVRGAAALSLSVQSRPDEPGNVKGLLQLMDLEYDRTTRRYMIIALGRSGSPDARDALLKIVEKGDNVEPSWAAIALGLLRDPSVGPRLRRRLMLEDDESTRGALCIALGLIRDEAAVPLLRREIRERDAWLPGYASLALALLGDRESAPAIRFCMLSTKDLDTRRNIAIALGLLDDRKAVEELTRQFREKGALDDRTSAAMAIGQLRANAAVPGLVSVALDKKQPDVLRAAAVAALGQLADPDPVPRLIKLLAGCDMMRSLPAVNRIAQYVWRR